MRRSRARCAAPPLPAAGARRRSSGAMRRTAAWCRPVPRVHPGAAGRTPDRQCPRARACAHCPHRRERRPCARRPENSPATSAAAACPITIRLNSRVVEGLEQVLGRDRRGSSLSLQPRKAVAGARRALGQPGQRLARAGCCGSGCRSARSCGTRTCARARTVIASAAMRATIRVRSSPRNRTVGDEQRERAVGRAEQPLRDRDALAARRCRAALASASPVTTSASFHARLYASCRPVFIPCAPAGLWMCAASPSRKQRRSRKRSARAVVDAIGREPAARLEARRSEPASGRNRRRQLVEASMSSRPRKCCRQDADRAPVIRAAHREEQVEAVAPQVDVELVRHHRSGQLPCRRRRTRARTARPETRCRSARAPRCCAPSQPATHAALSLAQRAVRLLRAWRRRDPAPARARRARCSTARRRPRSCRRVAQDALVVVLAQHQDERIRSSGPRRCRPAGCAPCAGPFAHMLAPVPRRPSSSAALGDAELRVDLERARLHAHARASRCAGPEWRSMISARTPRRASWLASISPVGPAPTIRTSVSIVFMRVSRENWIAIAASRVSRMGWRSALPP